MTYDCDPTFLAEVRRYGKFDVAGCFNCGSCTLSCDLAGDHGSFPRRSTREVLMGQRRVINESLDPWLCHDCGDCSTICPRQTEPREAMMTLRRYLAATYDWTGVAAKVNASKAWYLTSLAFVGVLVLLLTIWYHLEVAKMPFADFASTALGLQHMFPLMTYFTWTVILLPFLILFTSAFRMYWFTVHNKDSFRHPLLQWLVEGKTFFLHFFTYKKMAECPKDEGRWKKHLFLGIGCMMMLFVKVFALQWFQTDNIYPLYHPQRWIGYLATGFLLYGLLDIFIGRLKKEKEIHKFSDFRDWTFPIFLLGVTLSGIAVHICRYLGLELATHYLYALHLIIAVPMLVVEIPFGKWSHMIYRPLALYFQSLRERSQQEQVSGEEVPQYVAS